MRRGMKNHVAVRARRIEPMVCLQHIGSDDRRGMPGKRIEPAGFTHHGADFVPMAQQELDQMCAYQTRCSGYQGSHSTWPNCVRSCCAASRNPVMNRAISAIQRSSSNAGVSMVDGDDDAGVI